MGNCQELSVRDYEVISTARNGCYQHTVGFLVTIICTRYVKNHSVGVKMVSQG